MQGDATSAIFFIATVADPVAPVEPVTDPVVTTTEPVTDPVTDPVTPEDPVVTAVEPATPPVDTTPPTAADPTTPTSPVAPPTDTTPPTATFSPASGATITDADADIMLTFDEAIYQDTSGTVFDATTLATLITLKSTDTNGADIPFTASINAGNTDVTIEPSSDLENGVVYVAVGTGYYDEAQNQGATATNTFTVAVPPTDTTPPTATFSPASGATITDADADIMLTFDEAIYQDTSGTVFDATTLATLITLKSTDTNGADIPFTASINAGNTDVTIEPSSDLENGVVYVAVGTGYYDEAQNQGATATNTFTVAVPVETGFVVTSIPEDDAVIEDNTANITLTFNQPAYRDSNQNLFTTNNLASFVVLRTDDVYGYGIPFEASMSDDNMTITIDPVDTLQDGAVYVAISGDYYSADKTRGVSFKTTFSVDTGTPPPLNDFFSHLLTGTPFALLTSSTAVSTPSPSIEASEDFRDMQLQEALSLLQEALELLSIVMVIDTIDSTSPTAPTMPDQSQPAGIEGVGSDTEDTQMGSDSSNAPTTETPAEQTSADNIPDPTVETPTADTPSSNVVPVVDTPAEQTSADNIPDPTVETPTADTPSSNVVPVVDTPAGNIPEAVVDTPSSSTPEPIVTE